jgi:DNA (cytosine-5)-methyltransferase 1
MSTHRPLRAISLFTGVGGLDYGFEAAGFSTAVAVEIDRACCVALADNRDWPVLHDDIHSITTASLMGAAGLSRGEADVLIGGPPCQPFSKSGYWVSGDAKRLGDERADTLSAYLRVLEDARPRAFLLENVSGLAYRGKDEGLDRILRGIEEINQRTGTNYRPRWKVLNAASFGVPQLRERVFIVGSRDGRDFEFPEPTHADRDALKPSQEPYRSCWDVGRVAADYSRGRKLPVAYATRRWIAPLRLADALLELSLEACKESTLMDVAGAAGVGDWPLPLDE